MRTSKLEMSRLIPEGIMLAYRRRKHLKTALLSAKDCTYSYIIYEAEDCDKVWRINHTQTLFFARQSKSYGLPITDLVMQRMRPYLVFTHN